MNEEHFNKLTPRQVEALALLAEECAEVVQIVSKILRHGLFSKHPAGGPTNQGLLEDEIGDVLAAIKIAASVWLIDRSHVDVARDGKLQRVSRFLHHISESTFQ